MIFFKILWGYEYFYKQEFRSKNLFLILEVLFLVFEFLQTISAANYPAKDGQETQITTNTGFQDASTIHDDNRTGNDNIYLKELD